MNVRLDSASKDKSVYGKPAILVVDDDEDQLQLYKMLLKGKNCMVFTAASAADALEILKLIQVQLVICDVNMPEMNGSQLVSEIRKTNYLRELKIFAFSVVDTLNEEMTSVGADAFFPKSQTSMLLQQVEKVLLEQNEPGIDVSDLLPGDANHRYSV